MVDFIRVHFSMVGGLTQAMKIAHFSEIFGVRTAWHGPADMNPVGHAAQMHMGLARPNFGIQEWSGFGEPVHEVFSGIPTVKDGYAYVNDKPGFGVEFDEEAAKKIRTRQILFSGLNFVTRTEVCIHHNEQEDIIMKRIRKILGLILSVALVLGVLAG